MAECFNSGTATFLIMGNICTRDCLYCNVEHGKPAAIDENEINHLIDAVRKMKLEYVVITSVTRDDLPDGGAQYLPIVSVDCGKKYPACKIEVLIPDFQGNPAALEKVIASQTRCHQSQHGSCETDVRAIAAAGQLRCFA